MKKIDLRSRVDESLSFLSWDGDMRQRVLRRIDQKEEKKMRPTNKKTAALILALILMIVTMAVGLATGNYFGILQYVPEKADNQAYLDTILTVGQTYDLGAFSLTVNEAAFDGVRLLMTMEINAKEEDDPVFVLPRAQAKINGVAVETRWEGGRGFYTEEGFWVPYLCGNANVEPYPEYAGAEIALWNTPEGACFGEYQPASGPVEWEIVFDAYKPTMPIAYTEEDEPGMGEEFWTEEQYENHERLLADAYRNGEILLNAYADPWWYLACIPQRDGVDGGEKSQEEVWENAVAMGVFRLENEAVFRFETKPISVHTVENRYLCTLPGGLNVTLERLDVSVDQASMRLRITRADGSPAAESNDGWHWAFALLAEDAGTTWLGSQFGLQDDGSMLYESQAGLSGPAGRIRIVACLEAEDEIRAGSSVCQEVYRRQSPVTEEQKEWTAVIELE